MSLIVDIKKKFNNFCLDISFESQSQALGILGASGSGKSLTLKCIAGIEAPDEGIIIFNGKELFNSAKKINLKPQAREIGYLFQNYALFSKMTVQENILAGENGKEHNIKEILEKFRLSGLEKSYPKELSGGQQQRLALARMMTKKPKLILLDEPFSAMDSHLKDELQKELKYYIQEQGQEYVFVSHNQDELYSFSKEIALVDKGKVLIHKERNSLFSEPESFLAARLLGYQNILEIENIDKQQGLFKIKNMELSFHIKKQVANGISHVAIFAQDFKFDEDKKSSNLYMFEIVDSKEKAFTYSYLLKAYGQEDNTHCISWEVNKSQIDRQEIGQIINLSLDVDKIKLLRR